MEISCSSSSSSSSETESLVFLAKRRTKKKRQVKNQRSMEEAWCTSWPKRKSSSGVTLEGYLEGAAADVGSSRSSEVMMTAEEKEQQVVGRTKSLTDEDLDELKGCLDLGFGFSYDEIPELCNTLPALELCYSMSQQRFLDDQQRSQTTPDSSSSSSGYQAAEPPEPTAPPPPPPVANWKFSNPGDSPEEVKARLKYWAQAVACTVSALELMLMAAFRRYAIKNNDQKKEMHGRGAKTADEDGLKNLTIN